MERIVAVGVAGVQLGPRVRHYNYDQQCPEFAKLQQLRDSDAWEEITSVSWSDAVGHVVKLLVPMCGYGDCFFVEVIDPVSLRANTKTFDNEGVIHGICTFADRQVSGELAVGKTFSEYGPGRNFIIERVWILPEDPLH